MNSTPAKINSPAIFFIIGRSRSGTTLLRSMLDMHPNISIPNECTFILQLSKRYKDVKNWSPEVIERFIKDLKKTWLFENLKPDIENFRTKHFSLNPELTYQEICKQVLLSTPLALSKPDLLYVGDKNPSYSLNLKYLHQIFGIPCKYIYINRDYRDQFVSLKNAGIEIPNIVVSAKRWVTAFQSFIRISESNSQNHIIIRYEDLVSEPEKKLAEICSFLNIPYHSQMLEFYHTETLRKSFSDDSLYGIHKSIKNPVTRDKIGSWKNHLSIRQLRILDKISGKYEEQSGYKSCTKINLFAFMIFSFSGYLLYYFTLLSSHFLRWMPFEMYLKLSGGAFLGKIWNHYFRKN